MKEFTFLFEAKKKGAIGISEPFSRTVEAEDLEKANLKLYDEFDHIHKLQFWNGVEYFPVSYLYLDKKEGRKQNEFV